METGSDKNQKGRRSILYWITGALSALAVWKLASTQKAEEKKEEKVKMLTEDGQLVEVDPKYLANNGRKVTNDEIHNWITKKK